jgi:hypothetical protein
MSAAEIGVLPGRKQVLPNSVLCFDRIGHPLFKGP